MGKQLVSKIQTTMDAAQYKERLGIALRAANICVFEVDIVRQEYTFFENAEAIFGVTGERILRDLKAFCTLPPQVYQQTISRCFSHPEDVAVIDKAFQSAFHGQPISCQARMRAGDSAFIWCKIDIAPVFSCGKAVKLIGVITDISKMKDKTDSLEKEIRLDSFTGLYNKSYAVESIQNLLERHPDRPHALIVLDIDNFKHFNDAYGHAAGDDALLAIAGALKKTFRQTDILGRFGGDEFLIFVRNIPSRQWLQKKLECLRTYSFSQGTCTTSIGIALFPIDANSFENLFKKADTALYRAKREKAAYAFFTNSKP